MPLFAIDLTAAQTRARDAADWTQDLLTGVTALEWVLVAIAAATAYWVFASAWSATRLGAIEVDAVEHDGSSGGKVHERTSRLRERIADAGFIPPPQVPGGAPQADLLTAVAESPMPNANWIATLLKLVPRPRPTGYRLATTVSESTSASAAASIWLRPTNHAAPPLLRTLPATTVDAALDLVPAAVFKHVSNDAVHVFPIWARWQSEEGLRHYFAGIDAAHAGLDATATQEFGLAEVLQPSNVLVRLRLANLQEQKAAPLSFEQQRWLANAHTLRAYLDLVIERPELVEARYRASVIATRIVDDLPALASPEREDVLKALRMLDVPHERMAGTLTRIASRELDRALLTLQPWFALLVWRRPRYAVEPKGYERRRLRLTLLLARHCRFVRSLAPYDDQAARAGRDPWSIRWRIRLRKLRVRSCASRPTAGWQAYFNTATFFALLDARKTRIAEERQALIEAGEIVE